MTDLPDEAIDRHIAYNAEAPSELSLMHLYPIDGAAQRVGKDETPWGGREATWNMVIAAISPKPQDADKLVHWGKGYWKAVHEFNPGGAYVNFLMEDKGETRVETSFGDN